jgi:predicted phosphohydrolase
MLIKGGSKRKRTKEELEEVKQEEEYLKIDKQEFLQEVKRLKRNNEELQRQVQKLSMIQPDDGAGIDDTIAIGQHQRFII